MNRTHKHLLIALAWFVGCPLVFVPLFVKGVVPSHEPYATIASVIWVLGLAACFASWAWRDAPAHGKRVRVAALFTAAWLLLPVVAVIPYFFVTRSARCGLRASLAFVAYCVGCCIVLYAVAMFTRHFI